MVYPTADVRARKNLSIVGMTVVAKALIEGSRVNGVQLADGIQIATDNVFLCAGAAYASDSVALRHGPADDLRHLEITVKQDLPLGATCRNNP